MVFGSEDDKDKDEVDHQIDAIFDFVNEFAEKDTGKKWINHRLFFISMDFDLAFDFSEDAKTIKVPYKDTIANFAKTLGMEKDFNKLEMPKYNQLIPFIFARILDFQPTVREIKVFKEEQELFEEMKDDAESLNQ